VELTEREKKKIIELIEASKTLPAVYKSKLFDRDDTEFIEATKDYRLVYKGKTRKEDIIAQTPAPPFQKIRSFCSDNPFEDDWQNMLIFGDNLLALKTLYEDQRGENKYKTKNKIKLIYIDPPFATKQDFMKDREKAYRDKIIGAQFIEFLRRRLILLREILADNGCIYVHLDYKKCHYIKTIMDEVFGEENFQNEIVWERTNAHNMPTKTFARAQDTIFLYSKSDTFRFNKLRLPYGSAQLKRYKTDADGRLYTGRDLTFSGNNPKRQDEWRGAKPPNGRCWGSSLEQREKWWAEGLILTKKDGTPRLDGLKTFLEDLEGKPVNTIWNDVSRIGNTSGERTNYPTQKPEALLERIIQASSNENDIILDSFSGSGTTPVVAEKLNRRWIAMDCGKLAVYTAQRRMLNLTSQIGPLKKDERRDYERVADFEAHSKANSRGLFFIYEKARRGDLVITDSFLKNLSEFISSHLYGNKKEEFSLICPEDKLKLQKFKPVEDDESKAGEKIIDVGKVRFFISFIQPKEKTEKEKALKAKEFALFHAGVYDSKAILDLDWEQYKLFVAQLFGVRSHRHMIHGF